MRTLYQFSISHYCEKTRWHLDHKGLEFSVQHIAGYKPEAAAVLEQMRARPGGQWVLRRYAEERQRSC